MSAQLHRLISFDIGCVDAVDDAQAEAAEGKAAAASHGYDVLVSGPLRASTASQAWAQGFHGLVLLNGAIWCASRPSARAAKVPTWVASLPACLPSSRCVLCRPMAWLRVTGGAATQTRTACCGCGRRGARRLCSTGRLITLAVSGGGARRRVPMCAQLQATPLITVQRSTLDVPDPLPLFCWRLGANPDTNRLPTPMPLPCHSPPLPNAQDPHRIQRPQPPV